MKTASPVRSPSALFEDLQAAHARRDFAAVKKTQAALRKVGWIVYLRPGSRADPNGPRRLPFDETDE